MVGEGREREREKTCSLARKAHIINVAKKCGGVGILIPAAGRQEGEGRDEGAGRRLLVPKNRQQVSTLNRFERSLWLS